MDKKKKKTDKKEKDRQTKRIKKTDRWTANKDRHTKRK